MVPFHKGPAAAASGHVAGITVLSNAPAPGTLLEQGGGSPKDLTQGMGLPQGFPKDMAIHYLRIIQIGVSWHHLGIWAG